MFKIVKKDLVGGLTRYYNFRMTESYSVQVATATATLKWTTVYTVGNSDTPHCKADAISQAKWVIMHPEQYQNPAGVRIMRNGRAKKTVLL